MKYEKIPTKTIFPWENDDDFRPETYVEKNPNPNGGGNVEAFIDCFEDAAHTASNHCYNLPDNFILAHWGSESGWGRGSTQQKNQDWANMLYIDNENPPCNIGEGRGGWAKYYGLTTFANGYARYLKKSRHYKNLLNYLKECKSNHTKPSIDECIRLISYSPYGGNDHDRYYKELSSAYGALKRALKNM